MRADTLMSAGRDHFASARLGAVKGIPASSERIYTCPMHPDVHESHPGDCRKCGMPLEPQTMTVGGEDDGAQLRNMTMRLRIGAALMLPCSSWRWPT